MREVPQFQASQLGGVLQPRRTAAPLRMRIPVPVLGVPVLIELGERKGEERPIEVLTGIKVNPITSRTLRLQDRP